MSVWQLLSDTITHKLPSEMAGAVRLACCDQDETGMFARFAGLSVARNELLADHYRTGVCTAVIVVGLFPLPEDGPSHSVLAPVIGALFQWPGIAYLPYGFTREQLIATVRQVIEGARTPLPQGLLPTVGDVLRLTSEIRHWLENRLRNTECALNDFESARRGEIQLHRTHLESVAAISEEHRAMLDRLWALEVPAGRFAPRTGGLGPMKTAVAEFETRWQALEAARAALRTSGAEGREEHLAEAVTEFKRVRDALSAATMATRKLDNELITWEEN
jgi:hypothetical protein